MATIMISPPDTLKSFVESQIEMNWCGNVSEYLRGLLSDAQAKENEAQLEAFLLEGLAASEGKAPIFQAELKTETTLLLAMRSRKGIAR